MRVRTRGGWYGLRCSRGAPLLMLAWPALLTGCTTFTSVRSAEVSSGRTVDLGITYAPPPGDAAAWFWTWECASDCNHALRGASVGIRQGFVPSDGGPAFEVEGGLSGTAPYVDGYAQLVRGRHPLGIGARLSPLPGGWEGAPYARYDLVLGPSIRVLLNPAFFRHSVGGSRGTRGTFTAFAPGIGVKLGDDQGSSMTLSLVYVRGRSRRPPRSFDSDADPTTSFYVAGLTVSVD